MIQMRDWILDCGFEDLPAEDVDDLEDAEILTGVDRHYCGGVTAFVSECNRAEGIA
jgi:hypothetical protein